MVGAWGGGRSQFPWLAPPARGLSEPGLLGAGLACLSLSACLLAFSLCFSPFLSVSFCLSLPSPHLEL